MEKVRLGIIGLGMGAFHAQYLLEGKVKRCELTAVCDAVPDKLARYPKLKQFSDSAALIRSREVDAVLIATPHYAHTTIGIDALRQGLHVLCEKPLSVHKADCQRLIAAHKGKRQKFSIMLQMRTDPTYLKIRHLIRSGELGDVRRVNWTITNWFRTQAYYDSSGWRATWAGEGGGVLLNQCPHQIDLVQWLFGMPARVRAFCALGKYHKIEVEDDVTAYFEFPNRATGVFIASTGEAPGTNRLEIAGERGRLVLESNQLRFTRNEVPMSQFSRTSAESFAAPPLWDCQIPVTSTGGAHADLLQNFVDAILDGVPLIAPAEEGMRQVELSNAMLYSSFQDKTIELPLDGAAYERHLKKLIANSKWRKKVVRKKVTVDLAKSFNK